MKNPPTHTTKRRAFIKGLGATAAAAPFAMPAFTRAAPNGKLQHASIGVGGMGGHDLKNVLQHGGTEVVALCDVNQAWLGDKAKKAREGQSDVRVDVLDPLGASLQDGPELYFDLVRDMAASFRTCLLEAS